MMMVSMHTTIPSFHHFYMSFALQLHPLDAISFVHSFAFIASHYYYIGIKLTVTEFSSEMFIRHTCQSHDRQHAILLNFAVTAKRSHFCFSPSAFTLSHYFSLCRFRETFHPIFGNNILVVLNENAEHEIKYDI